MNTSMETPLVKGYETVKTGGWDSYTSHTSCLRFISCTNCNL